MQVKEAKGRKTREKTRQAFGLIELMLAMAISASLVVSYLMFAAMQSYSKRAKYVPEFGQKLVGVQEGIYSLMQTALFPLAGYNGVSSSYLANSSPFIYYDTTAKRAKILLSSDLTGTDRTDLVNAIDGQLRQVGCRVIKDDGSSLTLYCYPVKIEGATYTLLDGTATSNPLTFGKFGPLSFPIEATYKLCVSGPQGSEKCWNYKVGFGSFYDRLKEQSAAKFNQIESVLKSYYLTRLNTEVSLRPYPYGLHSTADTFVPWEWQAIADAGYAYSFCQDGSCSNFSSYEWKGSGITFYDVASRLAQNFNFGDVSYFLDPFGYPIRVILISNGCGGDLSTCPADNGLPPLPSDDYYDIYSIKPPFFTTIVSSSSDCLANPNAPFWCRLSFSYDQ